MMNKYLFFSFLLISYSPFSYAIVFYKDRIYPKMYEHTICDATGVRELIKMRVSQLENSGIINSKENPIPSEGCERLEIEVVFKRIAPEYFLPNKYNTTFFISDPDGKYPCSQEPEKLCREFFGPIKKYVEIEVYDLKEQQWYHGGFMEVRGDFELITHPDDVAEEGRSPDSLSQTQSALQAKFLVTLVEELNDAFSSIRAGEEDYNDSQIARGEDRVKEPPIGIAARDCVRSRESRLTYCGALSGSSQYQVHYMEGKNHYD